MKLYVADYLGDTHHLGVVEHGAYLLLLMAMWRAGGSLPAADANLAKLARCTTDQWSEIRDAVLPYFKRSRSRLTHKRLGEELAKYENTSGKRSEAGKRGAAKKANKDTAEGQAIASGADSNCRHNQNQNHIEEPQPLGVGGTFPTFEPPQPEKPAEPAKALGAWVSEIWAVAPKPGRERSGRRDLENALRAAIRRGAPPDDILAGVEGYYASPDATKNQGEFAKGVHVVVSSGRWEAFLPDADLPPPEDEDPWPKRLKAYRLNGYWHSDWGSKPGKPGCKAPTEALMSAGYLPPPNDTPALDQAA